MVDVTSEDFQKLLLEQKRTNDLLIQTSKDPTPIQSLKANIAEVLNERMLFSKDKKFQKDEGITEVDEEQTKTTSAIATASQIAIDNDKSQIFQLVLLREGIAVLGEIMNRMNKSSKLSTRETIRRLKDITPDPSEIVTASQEEEKEKEAKADREEQEKRLKGIEQASRATSKTLSFLKDLGKGTGIGGIIGKLFSLAGLYIIFDFLTKDDGRGIKAVANVIKNTVIPAVELILPVLNNVATFIIDYIEKVTKTMTDPDEPTINKIGTAITTLVIGAAVFKSKTIAKKLGTFALGLGLKGLFALAGLKIAFLLKPLLLVATLGISIIGALLRGALEGIKEGKSGEGMRIDNIIGGVFRGMLAGFFGTLGDLVIIGLGYMLEFFGAKETGEKLKKAGKEGLVFNFLNESFKKIATVIFDVFANLFNFLGEKIRRKLFGSTAEDFQKDIDRLEARQKQITNLDDEGLEREFGNVTDDMVTVGNLQKSKEEMLKLREKELEQLKKEREEIEKRLEKIAKGDRVGGMLNLKNFSGLSLYNLHRGGKLPSGSLAVIGESASGSGGELVYSGNDAMVMNQSRTDQLLTMALERGLSGGGGDASPIIVSSDNSVRSNISNMTSTSTVVTSNDSFTNAIVSSV